MGNRSAWKVLLFYNIHYDLSSTGKDVLSSSEQSESVLSNLAMSTVGTQAQYSAMNGSTAHELGCMYEINLTMTLYTISQII